MFNGRTTELEPGPGNWIVRTFSDELSNKNPSDQLSRGLARKVTLDREREKKLTGLRDQWNLFLLEGREMTIRSVPSEEEFLLEQSRKLYAAWTKFCNRLPENQRQSMSKDVPSLKQLHESVKEASDSWQESRKSTKTGRLKDKFNSLCKSVDNHSVLLSMIPSNDKYICLLTGSLSAIAQASRSHADIASGVAESLQELSENMVFWNSMIQEHGHTEHIMRCIMELYVVVFEFLTEIFDQWSRSSWKRLITSLNEGSFQKLFEGKRTRMRAIEQKMSRFANLEFQKNMRLAVGDMQVKFDSLMKNSEQADHEYKNMLVILGTNVQRLLGQSIQHPQLEESDHTELLLPPVDEVSLAEVSPGSGNELEKSHPDSIVEQERRPPDTNDGHRFQREDILRCLRSIVEAHGRDVQLLIDMTFKASKVAVDPVVGQRIADWTSSGHSEALWIQDPRVTDLPSQNTLTAVCLVALCSQNKIPCLSYFCTFSFENVSRPTEASPQKTLSNLLKSLITQIVLFIPDHLFTSVDLSQARFEQLMKDEEIVDFDHALHLLQDLRSLTPTYLHCIIEGIQLLEEREDLLYTSHLQRVLDELVSFQGTDVEPSQDSQFESPNESPAADLHVTKLCFTTDGYVDGLAQLVEIDKLRKTAYNDSDHASSEGTRRLLPFWSDVIE